MFDDHSHGQCVDKALLTAESICKQKGVRLTDLRKKVLTLVWGSHGPVKAYDILDQLGTKDGTAKPPTVYRALDFLTKNGLVHKLNSLNSYVGCSHPSQQHSCYFLICEKCGETKECCNPKLDKAISETSGYNRFQSTCITLEIQGLCEHCI